MEAALTNFGQIELPNKTLVLGDMLELGSASAREHAVVVGLIEKLGFKNVYLVGSNYSNVKDAQKYNCYNNVEELVKQFESTNIKNASILVKGSHGMHMEKVIPVL